MAEHNFQIFDESLTAIDTDQEYLAESQRLNGVTPGLAAPKMHNKLYRQCSVMAYAIASVLAQRGYNATDNDPAGLINAIQRSFAGSVNGNVPNGSGAISMSTPLDAWPVGSIFMTMSNANPATLLGGGTWVKLQGQYLLASSSAYTVGQTYGSMTKALAVENIPGHTHGFTTGSAGVHSHNTSGTAASAGAHTHTITANSNGAHTHSVSGSAASNGAHTHTITVNSNGAHTHSVSGTGANAGEHTHSASAANNGAHTHTGSGTTAGAGSHDHTRGSMNITGTYDFAYDYDGTSYRNNFCDGAFTEGAVWSDTRDNLSWINGVANQWQKMNFDASKSWTGNTSTVANHTHTYSFTTGSAGAHSHTITIGNAGVHSHSVSGTAASAGAHTHTGSAASNGAHTHTTSGTAASAGAHTHTGSAASAGAHTHSVTGTAANAGAHTHSGTTGSTGSGTAFNVQPLSIAVNVWRRTA